jgi:hypothetical protein
MDWAIFYSCSHNTTRPVVSNDGLKNLVIAQGHDIDNIQLTFPQLRYEEPMLLMRNVGGGKF